jgi:TP901 family phage tail tape measure protein
MGMESVYKLSVLLNVVDNLSGQMNTIQGNVSGSIQKLDSAFGTMQKAGAALTGVGGAILGVGTKLVTSTFDTQNALGELSSLGVKDLKAVENAAKSFSDTWAGTSKADFITASYDIKSGIASLTDEGVAQFTQLAALTGKATKSTTEEMGSLFATGYGIYKGAYDDLSDLEFGEMFSAGIATAVKNYKTSGSEMASAISALGATATNNNVPLEEQLAILGQLQTTMSGSEAATKYKSFLNQATKAGEALGLQLTDDNNRLLSTPEILEKLKGKYGETIDAVEKKELKDAFGTDEAVAMIDLLYNNVDSLTTGVDDLSASMKQGSSVTKEMAEAINNTPEQKFQVLKQQIHNNAEELGNGLLPAVNDTMDKVSGLIKRGGEWISNNQQTVQTIMNIALKLGVFLVVAGSVMGIVGSLGKLFLSMKNTIGIVKTAVMGLNTAFLASPVTWVIAGIVALIAIFVVLWNKSEAFRNFWKGLFAQVQNTVQQAWTSIQPALQKLGQKLTELWQGAVQPIIRIIEKVGAVVLTVLGATFAGAIQGALSALTPLINALTSFASFVTNVVNAVVALFRGDFSGALDFASPAADDFKNFILNGFDAILSFIGGFASGFLDAVGGALSAIGIDASETISKMKDTVKNGLEAVKGFFGNILGAASDTVKEKLGNMKAAYEEHGGGIKGLAAAAMEGVKGYFTSGYTFIDNLTGGKLTSIKNSVSEKMSGVANAVSTGMSAAKNYATTQLSAMQASYQSHGGGIKGIVAATMTGVQGTFSTAYSAINTLTGGRLESVRSTIANKIQSARDTVNSVLESIKSAFSSKLQAAHSVVTGAISRIRSAFNFSWHLPSLKLPHISVSGGVAPFGIGGKGSLPHFSIQWYKDGGILNGATIFGQMGGKMLGGGEAGAEAVLPLATLWTKMKEVVGNVVKGENEESKSDVQQTGASITSALTSKASTFKREKETTTTTNRETITTERWGKNGSMNINSIHFTVDISKIKDLPLLYKLIDELKDAQNRTDVPVYA